ncbi:MAG: hypothetical protein IPK78_10925 [Rhodospirillales bacterium]|nr:hypothetical protein [Rhodospirillales bacterium]
MAAAYLAVPRRHPHHDGPEDEEMIMATAILPRRHPDASITTEAPIEALVGGISATLGTLASWLTKLAGGGR